MTQYFHFTLGPVQGFVAQARRTRDLWAGSFLLSFLSAVAIKETQKQGGRIIFPLPDESFLEALESVGQCSQPQQGSIPNRFKAEVVDDFDPQKVVNAVQGAWEAIADQVLQKDLQSLPQWREKQQANWQSQVEHFWDMAWAITENPQDASILDKRKNWRAHYQPTQYGDKCMMMEGYQELSCAVRPNTQAQKAFWKALQSQCKLDLRDKEKLCAMAFIKRRFAHYFDQLHAQMPSGWTLKGWHLPKNVPSVQYVAASHWLEKLLLKQNEPKVKEALELFYHQAKQAVSQGEINTKIACIQSALKQTQFHPIANLDGAVFYESLLESGSSFDRPQPQVLKTLKRLNKIANLPAVSPFYAVLMMDGDSLGIQMSDPMKQQAISRGLDAFTQKVPQIIQEHNGFLIYAGGDDVLAILPLEDAMACATQCRQHYLKCFEGTSVTTTLSGAIEYVHIKSPLMKSISNAHHLLDEIAKDKTGRDAIAIRVMKPGNENAIWSMPWKYALDPNSHTFLLEQLSQLFNDACADGKGLSSQFIYKLREQYAHFNFSDFSNEELDDLLLVDYLSSGKAILSEEEARSLLSLLREQSIQYQRASISSPYQQELCLDMNAALIARFLAQKGVE